jgi:hypothetical protein
MWVLIIMGRRSVQVQVNFVPTPLGSFARVCRLSWRHCRGRRTTVIRFFSPTHRFTSSLLVEILKYLCSLTNNQFKINNSIQLSYADDITDDVHLNSKIQTSRQHRERSPANSDTTGRRHNRPQATIYIEIIGEMQRPMQLMMHPAAMYRDH